MSDYTVRDPEPSEALVEFRDAFSGIKEFPYCSGTLPLDVKSSTLFYRTGGGKAGVVDFAKASEIDLKALAEACHPASFGLKHEDVLDDSYRKAGKMDATDFSMQFSPVTAGVVECISDLLLDESDADRPIKIELYKLNVYSPGSFFKPHVDTPRTNNMFGSLVIILPTIHDGGSLIFRHDGEEHVYNSSKAVSSHEFPHAAFVAFYSDVEHEVALVKSGYRVTITYNLYFDKPKSSALLPADPSESMAGEKLERVKSRLERLLAEPKFIQYGGFLGFGLSHKYPFDSHATDLSQVALKGSDSSISRLCKSVGLDVSLKTMYHEEHDCEFALSDKFIPFALYDICGLNDFVEEGYGGTLVFESSGATEPPRNHHNLFPLVWIIPKTDLNSFDTPFITYGNESVKDCAYVDLCLVAEVGPAEDRKAKVGCEWRRRDGRRFLTGLADEHAGLSSERYLNYLASNTNL